MVRFGRSAMAIAAVLALGVTGLLASAAPAGAHTIPTGPKGTAFCKDYGQASTGSYDGIYACSGPTIGAIEFRGAGGDLITTDTVGFQCVELATRYLYSEFGIPVQDGTGYEIVTLYWSYIQAHPSADHGLEKVTPSTASAGSLAPGDVVSYATVDRDSHVDIVTKTTPSPFNGTGKITTLNENDVGSLKISVTHWHFGVTGLNGQFLPATGWLHVTGAPPASPTRPPASPTNPPAKKSSVTVKATANIFGAGRATPPDPGGSGGGTPPTLIALPAGTYQVEMHATGSVTCCDTAGSPMSGPAGNGEGSHISAPGSGLSDYDLSAFALVGVFLGPGPPTRGTGPPGIGPTSVFFNDVETPSMYQVFEVGTGSNGSSSSSPPLDFLVPHGATRLFLGFADADGFHGTAGHYDDNAGILHATVTTAPTFTYAVIGISRLDERSWPTLDTTVVGSLADHATIEIACQITGGEVEKSSIWDRLANGSYIPDWYTTTPNVGIYSPPILRC